MYFQKNAIEMGVSLACYILVYLLDKSTLVNSVNLFLLEFGIYSIDCSVGCSPEAERCLF